MITMMTLMVRRINNVKDAAMKQAILQLCVELSDSQKPDYVLQPVLQKRESSEVYKMA